MSKGRRAGVVTEEDSAPNCAEGGCMGVETKGLYTLTI